MRWLLLLSAVLLCSFGCSRRDSSAALRQLVEEFTRESLAFSPVSATANGYHEHKGLSLDELLDDYSEESLNRQRTFYSDFRKRLTESVQRERLDPQDQADYDVLLAAIEQPEVELNLIRSYKTKGLMYPELIGAALFTPYVLEYAPIETRYRHIIRRIRQIPRFLDQARRNLTGIAPVNLDAAIRSNEAVMAAMEKTYRAAVPPDQRAEYEAAVSEALPAMKEFGRFLDEELGPRIVEERLGPELYSLKFRSVLGIQEKPEDVLAAAKRDMEEIRGQMLQLAGKVCRSAQCRPPGTSRDGLIRSALDAVAQRHSTRETYFADAERDLEEARDFVRAKDLLTLPARDNLKVIETPEFMRGVYAVGGFVPAPPLQPELGAFYWLTPIPETWDQARVESKLREYNHYGLKLLTIHEAMPGHYVQYEHANNVQPPYRRVLRAVFSNGVYVEGWAVYATEVMIESGYLDNSPELALTFWKQMLRVVSNAILDIRYHMMNLSDEEAMALMINGAFQEREEATAKLRRLKLTSAQLPSYYVGWRAWRNLRVKVRAAEGERFRLKNFHDRALAAGPVPLPVLERLLDETGGPISSRAFARERQPQDRRYDFVSGAKAGTQTP
jgi:uncharacterized protein (DUF885 family)